MDGINEYDVAVFRTRYRRLISKTVELCFSHTAHPEYPGLVYLRGGDAINGGIHPELADTDEVSPIRAARICAEEEARGLEVLAEAFGRVHVVSVPGYHDRSTLKPRSKRNVEFSYDDMISWFLESHFAAKDDDRVTFFTPASGDAYFPVYGMRFLLTHGERIGARGGQGFIGPAATVMRGLYKTRRMYADLGKLVHYVLMGHFHTAMEVPGGLVNGALVGFNEYARDLRMTPDAPSQWLFFVDPRWGITQRRKIYLERPLEFREDAPWTAVPG